MQSQINSPKFKEILKIKEGVLSATWNTWNNPGIVFHYRKHEANEEFVDYYGEIQSLQNCGNFGGKFRNLQQMFEALEPKRIKFSNNLVLFGNFGEDSPIDLTPIPLIKDGEKKKRKGSGLFQQNIQKPESPYCSPICCIPIVDQENKIVSVQWFRNSFSETKAAFNKNNVTASQNYSLTLDGVMNLQGIFLLTFKIINVAKFIEIGIKYNRCLRGISASYHSNGQIKNQKQVFQKFLPNDQITMVGNMKNGYLQYAKNGKIITTLLNFRGSNKQEHFPFISLSAGSSISIMNSMINIEIFAVYFIDSLFEWEYDFVYELTRLLEYDEKFSAQL